MTRTEHYHDPDAPAANSLVPAASAIVANEAGEILLQRRSDNDLWSIPGGAMEAGETISETAIRETREETGLEVKPTRLIGIYCDPNHVVAYSDGEVRQEVSVCFACDPVGGELATSDESLEVGYYPPSAIDDMNMHESIRRRIRDYLAGHSEPVID